MQSHLFRGLGLRSNRTHGLLLSALCICGLSCSQPLRRRYRSGCPSAQTSFLTSALTIVPLLLPSTLHQHYLHHEVPKNEKSSHAELNNTYPKSPNPKLLLSSLDLGLVLLLIVMRRNIIVLVLISFTVLPPTRVRCLRECG